MNIILWRAFLVLIVLLPLPLGSFRPLAWSLEGVAVAALVLITTLRALLGRERIFWRPVLWLALAPLMIVVAWIFLQSFWPAPEGVAHPLWRIAGGELHQALRPRISIAPEDGMVLLLRLLTASGIFWLALQFGRDRDRAAELIQWLGLAAAAYAFYGMINLIAGNGYLLWYPRWAYLRDVTGTFVNRNTFATYAGIGLIALVALFGVRFQRAWRHSDVTLSWLGRRIESLSGPPTAPLLMAIVVAMALLQSHSRMGLFSSAVGLLLLLGVMRTIGLVSGRVAVMVVVVFGVLLFFASGGQVTDRILNGDLSGRPELAATADRIIASAPMLGSGYGAFPSVLPMYRDMSLPSGFDYVMAHNSYLEAAVELGIPAALALIFALALLAGLCAYGVITRSRDRIVPAVALSAAVLVAVHSLLDFSIQIPAVQYTLMALLGVGVAQSFRYAPRAGEPDA